MSLKEKSKSIIGTILKDFNVNPTSKALNLVPSVWQTPTPFMPALSLSDACFVFHCVGSKVSSFFFFFLLRAWLKCCNSPLAPKSEALVFLLDLDVWMTPTEASVPPSPHGNKPKKKRKMHYFQRRDANQLMRCTSVLLFQEPCFNISHHLLDLGALSVLFNLARFDFCSIHNQINGKRKEIISHFCFKKALCLAGRNKAVRLPPTVLQIQDVGR